MFRKIVNKKYDTVIDTTLKTGDGLPFKLQSKFDTEICLYRDRNEWLGQMEMGKQEFTSATEYAVEMGKLVQYFSEPLNQLNFYLDKNGFIHSLENGSKLSLALDSRLKEMHEQKRFAPEFRNAFSKAFNKPLSTYKTAAKQTPFYYTAFPPVMNVQSLKVGEMQALGKYTYNTKLLRYPNRAGAMAIDCRVSRQVVKTDNTGTEIKTDFVPYTSSDKINDARQIYERLYKAALDTPFKLTFQMYFISKLNPAGELVQNTGHITEQLSQKVCCNYIFSLTEKNELGKSLQSNHAKDEEYKNTSVISFKNDNNIIIEETAKKKKWWE